MTTHNTDNTRALLRALNMMHADGGGVAKIGAELASAGLRPMLIQGKHHGAGDSEKRSVTPAQMGYKDEHAQAEWGGTGGWKLHARSRAEWDDMVRRAKRHGKVNRPGLGISLGDGDGRVVCLDADTPDEREALAGAWVAWGGDPKIAETLSETTPGKVDKDGKARHHGGGHIWAVLPEPVALSELRGTLHVDAKGNAVGKGKGAALMVTKSFVVVAPTERTEGAYTKTGGAVEAPAGLVELINAEIEAARTRAEETARRAAERAAIPVDMEAGALAEWSCDTPWAELLTNAGWTPTGRDAECGCPEWQRWGGGSHARSAVAHEPSCTKPYWDMREGHAPLHIFSTSLAEGDPLRAMAEAKAEAQGDNLTKLQVYAAVTYPEMEPGEAISQVCRDHGWEDPMYDASILPTYGGGVTGGALSVAASAGLLDDYEAPEALNAAPVAGIVAENTTNNPAGGPAVVGADVTGDVTPAGTPDGTQTGTEAGTEDATSPLGLSDFMHTRREFPETPECRAFIEEAERDLGNRRRTAEQRARVARLFSRAERNPGLVPGDERDELWGGVPGWKAKTVVELMSATNFTRDVFWWCAENVPNRNPLAVLLLVLLHVGARMPVSVGPATLGTLPGPLSSMVIVVGDSGSGKSQANQAARAYCAERGLFDPTDAEDAKRHHGGALGTPQALAPKLREERPTTKPGAREGEVVETTETVMKSNPAVVSWDDELRSLVDGQRASWGTAETITSAWSGEDFLPGTNTGGRIPITGNYSLFIGGAIQGASAAGLLESEDLGLLQRAILVPARWPLAGLLDERDIPRPEAPPAADQVAVAGADRVAVRAELWPGLRKVHRMAVDAIPPSETAGTGANFNRARRWALPATDDVYEAMDLESLDSNNEDAGSYGSGGASGQTFASRARLASLLTVASWSEGQPMAVDMLAWAWASMLMELVTVPTLNYAKAGAEDAANRKAEREGRKQATKYAAAESEDIKRSRTVARKIHTQLLAAAGDVSLSSIREKLSDLQRGKSFDIALRTLERDGVCHKVPGGRKGSWMLRLGEAPESSGTPAVGTPAGGTAGGSVPMLTPLPGANEIGFTA